MNKARILIVEDEAIMARDLGELLTESGYEIAGFICRGEEAPSKVEEQQPDLVLMDIQLAGEMDGIEVAKIIRDRHSIPVVFLTAFSGAQTLERAKTTDPFGYIVKPFDSRNLKITLDIALYKHRVQRQQDMAAALLRVLNRHSNLRNLMQEVTLMFQKYFDCEAVGIRLQNGDGFPYYETRGFPPEFIELENDIEKRDEEGRVFLDDDQNPILECLCGNVLCERFNPQKPTFTQRGSFWTNSATEPAGLARGATDTDARQRCVKQGYQSIALIPLRTNSKTLGLIQLNDRRKNRFTPELITFLEQLSDSLAIGAAHRLAQEGMRKERDRYEALFEGISDAVYVFEVHEDAHPTPLLEVNSAACKMLGYDKSELLQMSVTDISAPESKVDTRTILAHLKAGRNLTYEQVLVAKTGKRIPVEIHAWPINLHGRKVLMSTVRNIEDRKELESQLRHSQKMEAVGTLAGGIAHDFNNVLAAMLLNLGFLQTDLVIDQSVRSCLKELQTEAERAAALTRQLLSFSQRSLFERRPFNLNDVIHNMLKMVRRLLGEQIQVHFQPDPELPCVFADVGLIEQVLMNLSVNARDAMPEGGTLYINTRWIQVNEEHRHIDMDVRRGQYVCITVADNGFGMDEETRRRAFEPYFTTKEQGKGTGLGLAIVHGIVAQHQGWIEVQTAPGTGTSFQVFLPAHEAAGVQKSQADIAGTKMPHGSETVLIVEDEQSVRRILVACLGACGYRVIEAASVSVALDAWQSSGSDIDLVFADIALPEGSSGLQLVEQLKTIKPDLKAIITSGYAADKVRKQIEQLGDMFLCKPYDAVTLAQAVRRCLDSKPKSAR